jgi:hypothetical protein
MKTEPIIEPTKTVFLQTVAAALTHLKQQLQQDYDRAYPELREIIHLVLDEEEARAWNLTLFPHLLLPDLVEAHIAKLNLRPAETCHEQVFRTHPFDNLISHEPAYACG